jgi:hypothetical protein
MNTVCAPLGTLLRNTLPGNGGTLDVFDDLLARAFACSCCLSHLPLLSGYDEPTTLSYQIPLFGPISADVRQLQAIAYRPVGGPRLRHAMALDLQQRPPEYEHLRRHTRTETEPA